MSIGLPIDTVTIPAYLRNELRGQTCPALCAIGTTGAPVATAKRAPPVLYLPCLPVARARAFRKHDDPRAFGHARAALPRHRCERVLALLAVDMNHLQHAQRPAEERHEQQFALEHVAERTRHQRGKRQRFPRRLMLRQQHGGTVGQVLHSLRSCSGCRSDNASRRCVDLHQPAAIQ